MFDLHPKDRRQRYWVFPFVLLTVVVAILSFQRPAAAQGRGRAVIIAPDVTQFPQVVFHLDVYDQNGQLITNLQSNELRVLEDDRPLPLLDLSILRPGVQFTVVLNVGPTLTNLSGGTTQYDRIQQTLQEWARLQPASSLDDFSLATNAGLAGTHLVEPSRWVRALTDYKPDLLRSQPGLTGLSQALDLAIDRTARPNMKRAILFVTPTLQDSAMRTIPNLADRAVQQGVRVFVWWMAPGTVLKTGEPLQQLALRSGGAFYQFNTGESFPNLENLIQPLRSIYRVTYQSTINQSGAHRLAVEVNRAGSVFTSETYPINLTVQPPNPIFLVPPQQIVRSWSYAAGQEKPSLSPASVAIQILVEFPDGHPRPLRRARLFVDDLLTVENTSPPLEQFNWRLDDVTTSGQRFLRVEVEDTLGLTQSSIKQGVDLLVEEQPISWTGGLLTPQRLAIIGATVLAAAAVTGALIFAGRRSRPGRLSRKQKEHVFKDPITQPVHIRQELPLSPTRPRSAAHILASARLVPVSEDGQAAPARSIPIDRQEMTIGSDPNLATCVLDSPAVDGLHARLTQAADGTFFLADATSVAGTWLNYAPVSSQGARLQHGDLIHIGQVAMRFELNRPGPIQQPQVTPYEEKL